MIRPTKKGLGTAITDGFKLLLSLKHPPKYIITMDADFSHNPRDVARLFNSAKKGYDLIIGSRYCASGKIKNWSPIRILISKAANFLASTFLGTRTRDCTSGLRCYSLRFVKSIIGSLHSQTYEIQLETVRRAIEHNFFVAELPIIFVNRKIGKSKLTFNEIKQFILYMIRSKFEKHYTLLPTPYLKKIYPSPTQWNSLKHIYRISEASNQHYY
jgi:dolichol-phosphate mannosyltransferase